MWWRAALSVLLALSFFMLPAGAAQADEPEAELPAVLFFEKATQTGVGLSVGDHTLSLDGGNGTESARLAIQWSAGLVGGTTNLQYTAQRAFNINGTGSVTAFLGCQGPAASPFQMTIRLTLNGGVIAGDNSAPLFVDSCMPTAVRTLNLGVSLDREVRVAVGDELGLQVLVWMVNPTFVGDVPYLYFLGESSTHPSRLELSVFEDDPVAADPQDSDEEDDGPGVLGRAQDAVGQGIGAVPWSIVGMVAAGLLLVALVSMALVRRVKRARSDPVKTALRGMGG